ncbi:hypothetical protein HFP15_22530 [Amycolatopsis sp. K13G38]|uniref:STAS domain-containing protein n=1 Tax=Amycolatopsis acididurans TaxID=2724524 RepID=A0ABX1J9T3_9PSEU|nr:hypothetical protein [Amycolatopsis acididurans]NKQ55659.1 hypothetical protein [Amycolatopsis acididurans]
MAFSATIHQRSHSERRLDLAGQVLEKDAASLEWLITGVILSEWPDRFEINLEGLREISTPTVNALLTGYVIAIEHGTSYHVLHASGQPRRVLDAAGVIEVLADSDDLGALLEAVVRLPGWRRRSRIRCSAWASSLNSNSTGNPLIQREPNVDR